MPSSWEYIVHGDAEAAVVDILLNDTPELPHFPPNPPLHITTNMISYDPLERWIVVTQEGSLRTWPKIDRPRIDVEVLAERRSVTHDIASIALASIERAMGAYQGFGLTITDVKLEQGITRVPDKLQETSRYIFSVRLTTVPFGAALVVPFS